MISLTDFFDAASRRHSDVILLPAIRRVSGNDFVFQQDSAPTYCAAYVQQLNCCVNKRQTLLGPTCGLQNSPDLSPMDYEIWAVMQHRVHYRQIHSVDGLKWRLIDVWYCLEQSMFDELFTSGGSAVGRQTCDPRVVGSSPGHDAAAQQP